MSKRKGPQIMLQVGRSGVIRLTANATTGAITIDGRATLNTVQIDQMVESIKWLMNQVGPGTPPQTIVKKVRRGRRPAQKIPIQEALPLSES